MVKYNKVGIFLIPLFVGWITRLLFMSGLYGWVIGFMFIIGMFMLWLIITKDMFENSGE